MYFSSENIFKISFLFRPSYAFRSDPCNMSTIVDAQYAPIPLAENEFLAFMPNICDIRKPVPLNLTPDEVILFYDTLMRHRQQTGRVPTDPEEEDLYGGSVNALPTDWYD